jgi:hypothetical protein
MSKKPKKRNQGRPARNPAPPPLRRPASALPDFDLEPLTGFSPSDLKVDTDLGQFALVLAANFNDLKNAIYAAHLAQRVNQSTPKMTPAYGQLGGFKTHALRIMFGVLRELMKEIREHETAAKSQAFKDLVAGLAKKHREAWERVYVIATYADKKPNARDATSQILEQIRQNVAYHYNAEELGVCGCT